jgi:hypothetical protein
MLSIEQLLTMLQAGSRAGGHCQPQVDAMLGGWDAQLSELSGSLLA